MKFIKQLHYMFVDAIQKISKNNKLMEELIKQNDLATIQTEILINQNKTIEKDIKDIGEILIAMSTLER